MDVVDRPNKCEIVHPDMAAYFTIGPDNGIPKVFHPMDDFYLLRSAHGDYNPVGVVEHLH